MTFLLSSLLGISLIEGVFHPWKWLFNHVFFDVALVYTLTGGGLLVLSTCALARLRKISLSFCSASSVLFGLLVLLFKASISLAAANDVSSYLVNLGIFDSLG